MANLKALLKSNYYLFKALRKILAFTGFYQKKRFTIVESHWENRIKKVMASPDNLSIARVAGAGQIVNDVQIMHNGIRIHVGSYYGDGVTRLLYQNKGVHEPEEEKAFSEILLLMPANAVMIELGSFWAFYSLWFNQTVQGANNFLIEPDPHAFLSGLYNFRLNRRHGKFYNYAVGERSDGKTKILCVDDFIASHKIGHVNILHSDIQGHELAMLKGAARALSGNMIDYIFISTHSNDLHASCIAFLKQMEYRILCESDLDSSSSYDGLIVAASSKTTSPDRIVISPINPAM